MVKNNISQNDFSLQVSCRCVTRQFIVEGTMKGHTAQRNANILAEINSYWRTLTYAPYGYLSLKEPLKKYLGAHAADKRLQLKQQYHLTFCPLTGAFALHYT